MPLPIQSSSSASATAARRKSLEQIMSENEAHGLKRSLTATQLILLGVGSTIGAGIYVMTGTAAAEYAGPSVLVSFVVAALACLFTAFSYGELSSTLPVSGSAYSYAYISMGEKVAWIVGWLLLLEYGISCAAVAAGLSGYASSL
ncbi:MAG: amino acid permease, partial [Gluconobacter cerinus]